MIDDEVYIRWVLLAIARAQSFYHYYV